MEENQKPWQIMPSKIILLAEEHAKQDTDFDHQLAFLLLDIGIESALKIYLLVKKRQDVEKINFPELLKRVKDELDRDNSNVDLESIGYYHGIRNKLYHQGDGVRPTTENLKGYLSLAQSTLKTLLDVDVDKLRVSSSDALRYFYMDAGIPQSIESLAIPEMLSNFYEIAAVVAEQIRPQLASRKSEHELRKIWDQFADNENDPHWVRTENQEARINNFNLLLEKESNDHEFIDAVLQNPKILYARIALQESSEDWRRDWKYYNEILEFIEYAPNKWRNWVDNSQMTPKQIIEKEIEIEKWIREKTQEIQAWLDKKESTNY